jgi:predicted amidohydrolase YtcJ
MSSSVSARQSLTPPRVAAGFILLLAPLAACAAPQQSTADELFTHGEFYTPHGGAQTLAVKDGVIVFVGTETAAEQYKGATTRVIDLHGAAVLPGLHDMHVHPLGAGATQLGCNFPQGSSLQTLLDTVKQCVARHGKGEWIVGGQWDASSLGPRPPDRQMLDAVAPDNPVALTDISGHSVWANTKALQLGGIALAASTPNPAGGIIERDAHGVPNGVLREAAAGAVRAVIPQLTPEQNVKALSWSLQKMLSYGITAFTDAALDESGMRAYATLADEGLLKQRVKGCLMWRAAISGARADDLGYIDRRNTYRRERFSPTCIKIFLDGVPTDGHTAAMVEPYADAKEGDPRARGLLLVPANVLNPAVTRFDAQGLTVKFHAAGDAAVRAGLDAIEAARKANGSSGLMHEVGHDSFVQMSDIRRAKGIGATF